MEKQAKLNVDLSILRIKAENLLKEKQFEVYTKRSDPEMMKLVQELAVQQIEACRNQWYRESKNHYRKRE